MGDYQLTINSLVKKCRFCLSDFGANKVLIDENLQSQFEDLCHLELKICKRVYSSYICHTCFQHFSFSYNFIAKLVEQQKELYEKLYELETEETGYEHEKIKLEIEEDDESTVRYEYEYEQAGATDVKTETVEYMVEEEYLEEYNTENAWAEIRDEDQLVTVPTPRQRTKERNSYFHKGGYVSCSECEIVLKRSDYLQHLKNIHPEVKGPWCCDICGINFAFKSSMTNHLSKHLGYPDFQCPECPRSFTMMELLAVHLNKHRKRQLLKGTFLCTHCGRVFNTRRGQINHEKTRHSDGIPQFHCDYPDCDVVVTNPQKLAIHKQYHRNETFLCEYQNCGKVFKSMSEYNRHKFHHRKPYKCDVCEKGFASNAKMVFHKKTIHEGILEECHQCGRKFGHKLSLEQHIAITHLDFRMPCEVPNCKATFGRKQHYRRHVNKFHTNLPADELENLLLRIKEMKDSAHILKTEAEEEIEQIE